MDFYLFLHEHAMRRLLKIILTVVLSFSIMGKLYYFRDTVQYFTYLSGLKHPIVLTFLTFLVLFELLIVFVFIFQYEKHPFFYYMILCFFIVMLVINIFFHMDGVDNCACFGAGIRLSPAISILKCILLLGGMLVIRLDDNKPGTPEISE